MGLSGLGFLIWGLTSWDLLRNLKLVRNLRFCVLVFSGFRVWGFRV